MWHWDQGRLAYFQFDALRQIAAFVVNHDFKTATREDLLAETGLDFAAPDTHSPWRNYSRVLKLSLLVNEVDSQAKPTPVAEILAKPGIVTCDEYLHFLVRAFTEPSPALADWHPNAEFRYPLLFSLKYLLAKTAIGNPFASVNEIIGAYKVSNLTGDEDDNKFAEIVCSRNASTYETIGQNIDGNLRRQARESLNVISQISYLHISSGEIILSLHKEDALMVFRELTPIIGPRAINGEGEIYRLSTLFRDGSTNDCFDYPNTVINDAEESGFKEGTKVQKTHITIERNAQLRKRYFEINPTEVCDICRLMTAQTYPWVRDKPIIDLHHLLPLSSGTRVEAEGTTVADLVPVCPSCHRAIHRFYDSWLRDRNLKDFSNKNEAVRIYQTAKSQFPGLITLQS